MRLESVVPSGTSARVEILFEFDRIVDAVVSALVEFFVLHAGAMLEVQQARTLSQAVSHQGTGCDDRLHPTPFDHFAEQESLFCDGHRAGYRDDPEAIAIANHLLEHVCGFPEAAASERGLGHRAHEGIDTGGLVGVEGREGRQPVIVTGSVLAFVARARH